MSDSGPFSGDTCIHKWHDGKEPGPCPGCGYSKPSEISLLPPHTRDFIYATGTDITWYPPGDDETECEGAAFHSPRPLFVRETPLALIRWWAGPADDERDFVFQREIRKAPTAHLCGTCRDNLSILLQMLHATDGDLPWAIRREFGNKVRALASKGWKWFEANRPTTGGTP